MKKKLTNNLGLKILAILFSFALWLIVVNMNDPVITVPYSGITVEIVNKEAITEQGKVYEIIENTGVVTVSITANRSIIDTINKENIHAVADMKEVSFMDTVRIEAYSDKNNDKIDNIKSNTENLKLKIEDMKKVQLVITPMVVGVPADGYVLGEVTTDQNIVRIAGPESVVSSINKAVVVVDVGGMTSGIKTNAELKLYDAKDNLITNPNITQNINSLDVSAQILATKEVPINILTSGKPANGYMATGVIEAEMETVQIAGSKKVLEQITQIDIPETVISLSGASENVTQIIELKKYLPDKVILADNKFNGKISVTVYIDKAVEKTFDVPKQNFTVGNLPLHDKGSIEGMEDTVSIRVVGLKDVMDSMRAEDIKGVADMALYMENEGLEKLNEGFYVVNATFALPEGSEVMDSLPLTVFIEKNE